MSDDQRGPWYGEGLRFACTECGACCTGQTGYVWVSLAEANELADSLGLELDAFGRRYLRKVGSRYSLVEDPVTGACVFLDNNRCAVHTTRPSQCRSFPFWDAHLGDSEQWARAADDCEGISDDAPLIGATEIERLRKL